MTHMKVFSMGSLAVLLIAFVAGRWELTGAAKVDLKAYTFYPGIGYLEILYGSSSNWTERFKYCVSTGGHLAVPNSEAEADVYEALIASIPVQYQTTVFIGFHDLFVNGEYETVHDYPLARSGYNRWALGTPNVSPTLRCGGFSKDGGLLNLDCALQTEASFICELPSWADYDYVPGVGYYKFHTDGKNWTAAWKACRDEDSHLAVINSVEEHQVLQDIFARHPNIPGADYSQYAWVGVHSKFMYRSFRTVVGTALEDAGFATWFTGEPEDGLSHGLTSGLLIRNDNLGLGATLSLLGFFCEHEL